MNLFTAPKGALTLYAKPVNISAGMSAFAGLESHRVSLSFLHSRQFGTAGKRLLDHAVCWLLVSWWTWIYKAPGCNYFFFFLKFRKQNKLLAFLGSPYAQRRNQYRKYHHLFQRLGLYDDRCQRYFHLSMTHFRALLAADQISALGRQHGRWDRDYGCPGEGQW